MVLLLPVFTFIHLDNNFCCYCWSYFDTRYKQKQFIYLFIHILFYSANFYFDCIHHFFFLFGLYEAKITTGQIQSQRKLEKTNVCLENSLITRLTKFVNTLITTYTVYGTFDNFMCI